MMIIQETQLSIKCVARIRQSKSPVSSKGHKRVWCQITQLMYNCTQLTLNIPGVDRYVHQLLFLRLSQKFFPATYDETLCKFLLYTYEDSHNLFWSKIISREHVEYIYVAWVENVNFKICNFRVLRSILEGFFIK